MAKWDYIDSRLQQGGPGICGKDWSVTCQLSEERAGGEKQGAEELVGGDFKLKQT